MCENCYLDLTEDVSYFELLIKKSLEYEQERLNQGKLMQESLEEECQPKKI